MIKSIPKNNQENDSDDLAFQDEALPKMKKENNVKGIPNLQRISKSTNLVRRIQLKKEKPRLLIQKIRKMVFQKWVMFQYLKTQQKLTF